MKFYGGKAQSVIVFSLLLVTAIGVITFGVLNKNDELVRATISDMSRSTEYELIRYEAGQPIVLGKGRLGDFYSCLVDYRSTWDRRVPKNEGHESDMYELKANGQIMHLTVVAGEAYMFSIDLKPNSADIYAINCDLSLLGNKS